MNLIKIALRLASFRRVAEDELPMSWMRILGIAAATLLPPLAYALIDVGTDGMLDWHNLPAVVFHIPMMLAGCVVVAYFVGRSDQVMRLFAATMLAWLAIDFSSLALWLVVPARVHGSYFANLAFYVAPLVWLALAMGRFSARLSTLLTRRGAIVASLLAGIFVALPLGAVYRERSLWTMDYERKYSADAKSERRTMMRAAATEESFYRQPDLLRQALADIKPERKGVIDVYMVGVAGYGNQDVFMREVDSVAKLFRERFDADGHIVKLVNNPKTAMSLPIASSTSLRAALKRVGTTMNADEDLLVLFLTSHGSQDHHFSLELWPLELKQLDPAMLREMLDASGIKNRVVIVSACYAGGFVKALSGDNTVVIAAAAPDRNSFGCSNENDWTYFGKAYFDEALRKTLSFTQAFEMAKTAIDKREKEENFDPSMPQMAVGGAIKAKLAALERQLDGGPSTPPVALAHEAPLASLDKAEQYVSLLFQPEMARSYYAECKRNMELNGPEKTLERAPETLGGLNHASPQWPRFVSAWDRYAEEACRRMNDPNLYRDAYLRSIRESMSDADLDVALRMLGSADGHRMLELEKRLSLKVSSDLAERQAGIRAGPYREFVAERDRLLEESTRRH